MNEQEMRARLEQIETELRGIDTAAGDAQLTDEQQTEFDRLRAERSQVAADLKRFEDRSALRTDLARSARSGAVEVRRESGANNPELQHQRDALDPLSVVEDRSTRGRARDGQLRSALLRSMEDKFTDDGEGRSANERHFEGLIKRHGKDHAWMESLVIRSTDVYADAFSKVMTGNNETLSNEERAAIAVGTNTAGGFLVPTHLDPSLMLTNAGSANDMRRLARTVTLTEGSVWTGVTTAGVTASWDGELVEVSDDSPAVANTQIRAFKGASLVQASIEAFEDIAGLAGDVMMLFADAKDRLEGVGFMTGGGTNNPLGLFTAISASASLQVVSTTAATIGEVDIHALYRALPQRWRSRGSFVANPLYTLAIKRLGVAVSSSYSGDLREEPSGRILGRPSIESDDAPTTQTTTALDQEVVFADLSQYVIVDKPGGMSVEFIPHMFNVANNLPDGRRAWYMHWRTGGGFPNLAAGRILMDKTSA
jgi:HK97 family phage major capsid protein